MTDRETLTAHLWEAWAYAEEACACTACCDCPASPKGGKCMTMLAADHLLANGVVVREWIPVTERLPDLEIVEVKSNDTDLYPCLVVIKHERATGGRYISKLWYDGIGFIDGDCIDKTSNVTHWMPLPEPPKENDYEH